MSYTHNIASTFLSLWWIHCDKDRLAKHSLVVVCIDPSTLDKYCGQEGIMRILHMWQLTLSKQTKNLKMKLLLLRVSALVHFPPICLFISNCG